MNQTHPSVILVTGAATGIGQLSAHSLAETGHTVYASMRDIRGRNAARARNELDYAQSRGVDLHVVELDVTSQESANQAVQAILEEQGRIDVVLHNAGHLVVGNAEAVNALLWKLQEDYLTRMGFANLLHPVPTPTEA